MYGIITSRSQGSGIARELGGFSLPAKRGFNKTRIHYLLRFPVESEALGYIGSVKAAGRSVPPVCRSLAHEENWSLRHSSTLMPSGNGSILIDDMFLHSLSSFHPRWP